MKYEEDSIAQAFDEHRQRVLKWFLFSVSALLLPFDLNHFIQGRHALALTLAATIILFFVTAVSIQRKKTWALPYVLVFVPITATLGLAIWHQGVSGVFWAYPAVLLAHYTLQRNQANWVTITLSLLVTFLVYDRVSIEISIRVGATMLITVFFANVFLTQIEGLVIRMRDLAAHDPLTKVFNRRQFEAELKRQQDLRRRYGTPVSMLLIDIDHFKQINDTLGHDAGDQVLISLAERLRASLRSSDLLFRIGGEEFVILLPAAKLDDAKLTAEKIRNAVAEHPLAENYSTTISIGIAELGSTEETKDLFKRCDDAMYQAKAAGRNRACVAYSSAVSDPAPA